MRTICHRRHRGARPARRRAAGQRCRGRRAGRGTRRDSSPGRGGHGVGVGAWRRPRARGLKHRVPPTWSECQWVLTTSASCPVCARTHRGLVGVADEAGVDEGRVSPVQRDLVIRPGSGRGAGDRRIALGHCGGHCGSGGDRARVVDGERGQGVLRGLRLPGPERTERHRGQRKTTVLRPLSSTRRSLCQRTARDSASASASWPTVTGPGVVGVVDPDDLLLDDRALVQVGRHVVGGRPTSFTPRS